MFKMSNCQQPRGLQMWGYRQLQFFREIAANFYRKDMYAQNFDITLELITQ